MTDIITRLLAATGPDRELDALIYCELHAEWTPTQVPSQTVGWVRNGERVRYVALYTSFLDTALTTFPPAVKSWLIGAGRVQEDEPTYGVQLWSDEAGTKELAQAEHDNLSICAIIAALKAREVKP